MSRGHRLSLKIAVLYCSKNSISTDIFKTIKLYYSNVSDELKTDPNTKNYLDHLGKCTAEELSLYSNN